MRKLALMFAVVACVGAQALAEDSVGVKTAEGAAAGDLVRAEAYYKTNAFAQLIKVCELTQEQQDAIKKIEADRDAAIKEWQGKNADKIAEARKALEIASQDAHMLGGGDTAEAQKAAAAKTAALVAAQKAYQELYAPYTALLVKAHVDVFALLTDDQRAKWADFQVAQVVKAYFADAKLTDEQMKKIKEIYAGLVKEDPQSATSKLYVKVQKDVLTDEQKEAMVKTLKAVPAPETDRKPAETPTPAPAPAKE